jgi:hypothetical protein
VLIMFLGTAVNLTQESEIGLVNCKTIGLGEVENPEGNGTTKGALGPAGVGKVLLVEFYGCHGTCETSIAEAKDPGSGSPLEGMPGEGVPEVRAEVPRPSWKSTPPWNLQLFNTTNDNSEIEMRIESRREPRERSTRLTRVRSPR